MEEKKVQQAKLLKHLSNVHPCFAVDKKLNSARLHLPVCPQCNIRCNFCIRSLNNDEDRPGVAMKIINPENSVQIVQKALAVCPELKVIGIAGPGDSLVTDNALQAFALLQKADFGLMFCLSTNGLLLADKAEALAAVGVKSLTVTVNAVQPEIQQKICGEVFYDGVRYTGYAAAEKLIERQRAGIKKAAALGMVIKINVVLIPGINDEHIETIAETVKEWGASLINIIPLIPQFRLKDIPAPGCEHLQKARQTAEKHLQVFRHCSHCRADAVGVPGASEYRAEIFEEQADNSNFSHG